ncbi:MAG: hypothetical protein ACFE8L_03420 [Candidatus Hodarchaeota archaeon]
MSSYKGKLLVSSLILISLFSVCIVPGQSDNSGLKTSSTMADVIIDGNITKTEWTNAEWNISFYLDIDNTPDSLGQINVDGNNSLYLGRDSQHLYIALDLWSDRSYNQTGEWVGVWLNTKNREFTNSSDWLEYINDGTESLLYDVEYDRRWVFYSNDIGIYTVYLTDDSDYSPVFGEIEGSSYNFQYTWRPDFNITSELVGSDQIYRLDFSIDLDKYLILPGEIDVLQELEIRINSKSNTTIDSHKIILWYNDGSIPPLTDTNQVIDLNTATSYLWDTIPYGLGNLTTDKKLQFSLFGNHTDAFVTNFNQIYLRINRNMTNYAGPVDVPYSSINTYEIAWDFGPSVGNSSDHRMFEIAIPTSELEGYKSYKDLGIIVGGYGTMLFKGTNYWCFSEIDTWLPYDDSSDYKYYNMGGTRPKAFIPGYNLYFIMGILGVISLILIKNRSKLN